MAPDVDPIGERDEGVSARDRPLDAVLPVDAEPTLEVDHAVPVGERFGRRARSDVADREVGQDRARTSAASRTKPLSRLERSHLPTGASCGRVGDGDEMSLVLTR